MMAVSALTIAGAIFALHEIKTRMDRFSAIEFGLRYVAYYNEHNFKHPKSINDLALWQATQHGADYIKLLDNWSAMAYIDYDEKTQIGKVILLNDSYHQLEIDVNKVIENHINELREEE
jgi:hypothetical protein